MVTTTFSRLLATLLLAVAFIIAGCGEIQGRDQFSKMVMEKSEQEVQSNVGKPASVDASDPQHVKWIYNGVTVDFTHESKLDAHTTVIFAPNGPNGKLKVVEVQYS